MGAQRVRCWSDSNIASEQINNVFHIKDPHLLKYYYAFQKLWKEFNEVQVVHIRYDINDTIDELARLETLPRLGQLKTFKLCTLSFSYVSTKECLQVET